MRTNIEIDDDLILRAMKITGASTKKGAVEAALRLAVQLHRQENALKQIWGIGWEGDLDAMREDEHLNWDPAWKIADQIADHGKPTSAA
jgi:Arc/MetJ family transcription regulator